MSLDYAQLDKLVLTLTNDIANLQLENAALKAKVATAAHRGRQERKEKMETVKIELPQDIAPLLAEKISQQVRDSYHAGNVSKNPRCA